MSSTKSENKTNNDQKHNVRGVNALAELRNTIFRPWLVKRDSKYYKMDHFKRGVAVIFNQETFINWNIQLPSNATDCGNLNFTLKSLGFEVLLYCNKTLTDLKITLETVASMDHSENDCLIIVVLTYGNHDYLYAADTCYKVEFLCNHFTTDRCPSLAGKPKLFFIQTSPLVIVNPGTPFEQRETDDLSNATFCIEPDFLIVYSTIPDTSLILQSSWFIEALCLQLYKNATSYDLMTLLTFVRYYITTDYYLVLGEQEKRQVPCVISMLTRLVKFTQKYRLSQSNDAKYVAYNVTALKNLNYAEYIV